MKHVYEVTEWERYENDTHHGLYKKKKDAELVRDHLEAIAVDKFVSSYPLGRRDELSKNVHWLDYQTGFVVNKREVF